MYVYYKDKNDTIGYIELKLSGSEYVFDKPVFVFKILKTFEELREEKEKPNYIFGIIGLNPYEQAYISNNLNLEFEIQEHMFTMKRVVYNIVFTNN